MPSMQPRASGTSPAGRLTWVTVAVVAAVGCGSETTQPQPHEPDVATVTVTSPLGALVAAGTAFQLTAAPTDADGAPVSGVAVTWQSSDPDVATVSAAGSVNTLAAGPVTITATADDADGTVAFSVAEADVGGIAATVTDPLVPSLLSELSTAGAAAAGEAIDACDEGAGSGDLTMVQQCVAGIRAAAASATDPDDTVLLAVLVLFIDRVEQLLNL